MRRWLSYILATENFTTCKEHSNILHPSHKATGDNCRMSECCGYKGQSLVKDTKLVLVVENRISWCNILIFYVLQNS